MTEKRQTQGIVRTGRGEEQPADKERAQRDSGFETHSSEPKVDRPVGTAPGTSGHS